MAAKTTHGMSKSRAYETWAAMKKRCHNPNGKTFARYGSRGISVCERWRNSFEAFHEDMGDPPDGMSLDRIDNEGNYSPENCRWATRKEQTRNRRNTVFISLNGEMKTLFEWAALLKVSAITLATRRKRGWSDERILKTPIASKKERS